MRSHVAAFMFACAILTMSLTVHADADIAKGKVASQTCLGCHGIPDYTNVYPTYRVPELAGQNAAYIVHALEEYKSGARSHLTMHAQASSLSQQEMQDIAAYFQSLGPADNQ
ncbi:MAG TPA: cytochrome c [Gammaproteobacteria bacterium]|nr:cytochrome c [Gammaproteobacteria bacterium]